MVSIERFAKTPKAWDALARPGQIGRQAHSLLLMANGRRSERELSMLLGSDVSELAHGLQQQGYLQPIPLVMYSDVDITSTAEPTAPQSQRLSSPMTWSKRRP